MPVPPASPAVLLVTDWHDERFNRGVVRFARRHGWRLSLEAAYSRGLPLGWRGDGCIAMIACGATEDFVSSLGVPTVDTSHSRIRLNLPRVHDDDRAAGRMAARCLLERRHRRLVFCSPGINPVSGDRLAGFSEEARKTGTPVDELLTSGPAPGDEDWAGLRNRLSAAIARLPRPSGMFCVDDRLAALACEVAAEVGVAVPGDLAVLGVGNLEIACEASCTPLSSVALDPEAHGYAAAAMLAEVLAGKHGAWPPRNPPVRLLPPVGVIERESTRGIAAHDPALARAVASLMAGSGDGCSIGSLAHVAGVGPRKLYALFAEEFRCTPAEFAERVRLNRACRLLLETDMKLFAVAKASGFGTTLRLHRTFGRRLGQSPGRWRRLALSGKALVPGVLPSATRG